MKARTGVFIILSLMQILNLFNMRSLKQSIFTIGMFTNRQVNYAFVASFLLLLGVVYVPFVSRLFEFEALTFFELGALLIFSTSILFLGESVKLIQRLRFDD